MKYLRNNLIQLQYRVFAFVMVFILVSCTNSTSSNPVQPEETAAEDNAAAKKNIKIALLLDTSSSMNGLIEQAKSQLWQLVNELAQAKCEGEAPLLEIALYEYGNDRLSSKEGYIKQVTSLTSDLDKISEDLFALTTNGGSEYCGQVIQTAITQQEWSRASGDLQIIFIAGNEEFTQGNVSYKQACANAKENNIIVNTIHCGSFDEGIRGMWKDGADRAGGQYMCIEQDRKTVYIESPYDDRISELNVELNKTYIGYGKLGRQKKEAQQVQDNNAESISKVNSVKRAVSKSSHFYKNEQWDLVDASKDESFKIEEIKEEELPEELKGKSKVEKEQYIADMTKEREQIQNEIKELNVKRQKYVEEKRKESDDDSAMLDKVMIKAIKEQAETKDLVFE